MSTITIAQLIKYSFILLLLPRCMQCRHGLAMRILSVGLSVYLSVCQTRAL